MVLANEAGVAQHRPAAPANTGTHDRVLGDWLRAEAAADPDREFVQCDSDWMTLGELNRESDQVAAGLQAAGIARGDRVALLMPNRIEYIVLVYALAKAGAIQVPINTFLRGQFLRHQLGESGASMIITDNIGLAQVRLLVAELPDLATVVLVGDEPAPDQGGLALAVVRYPTLASCSRPLDDPELSADDLCVIMYTSGTTGPSKGCMISHGYYCSIPLTFLNYGWFQPGDRIYGASPLFHFTGQVTIVANALAARGSAVLDPVFHATTFMARAREVGATAIFGVGAMAMAILAQPAQPDDREHGIRQATWIPMTESNQMLFLDRFGIPVLSEIYGQSECWPATMSRAEGSDRRPAALGRGLRHLDVRVVDDDDQDVPAGHIGEILVRPKVPNAMFGGYWNNPAATANVFRNGWHHTGDHAVMDEHGFLYFKDRKKDSLRRRGENVSSMELEGAISTHPAIAQVAVHAVPSELGEDEIKACIVLRPDMRLTPQEFFAWVRNGVPYYAIPRYLEFLDELPVTPTLRVQKYTLRERGITATTIDLNAEGLVVERHERRGATAATTGNRNAAPEAGNLAAGFAPAQLFDLTGRVAIITGGTRGLGWAIAQGYLAAGAKVVVASRDSASVASAEQRLRARGGEALGVAAHVGHLDDIARLVDATVARFGGIDIIVNNAANPLTQPVGEHTAEAWAKSYDVNLRGPVFLVEAALPHLRRSSAAVVLNVISAGAFMYSPETAMYCGAKAALLSWTRSLAAALAPDIRVNALAPGVVMTDMIKKTSADYQARMQAAGLLRRGADPAEMIGPALFLASDAASFMTGQVMIVDGGLTPGSGAA